MLPFTRPTIGAEEQQAVRDVLASGWITSGPKVMAFERALSDFLGHTPKVRAFNSCTSALEASLLASGIGPGDEVILPAMSFIATANAVVRSGAKPVFVDVDLQTRNLGARAVEKALSVHTRAVMPVHFAGLPADLQPLYELAEQHRLTVIEDAAQAIGSEYAGRKIGASGNPVCFSFHPNKNITTIEGGAVASSDPQLIRRLERIRFHGLEWDDAGNVNALEWGGKMNMPDVGAALGLVQLKKLVQFNWRRRELARRYLNHLPDHAALVLPTDTPGHSWHMFCVCVDYQRLGTTREAFRQALTERDVGSGIHYPAIHTFGLYRRYGYTRGDFPVAERIGAQTLTLPLFPTMSDDEVDKVCQAISELLS